MSVTRYRAPSPLKAPLVGVRTRTVARAGIVAGLLALAFHIAHGQFGLGGHGLDDLAENWIYDGIVVGSAAACLARAALVAEDRLPWLVLGIGLAFDATGEIYYSLAFGTSGNPPTPSLADLFYLLYYPCAYGALVLLLRRRLEHLTASAWLDGAIAAASSAAAIAAIAFEPILRTAVHGNAAAVATNLAYPIGDLVLFAIVIGVFALSGWRPGRAWFLLGAGLALSSVADTAYVYANASGTYEVGGILDSLWLAAALAVAGAAWQPSRRSTTVTLGERRLLVIPGVFALVALAVLLYGALHHVGRVGLVLSAVAMLLVIVRAAWALHENLNLLDSSRHDAVTDSLTGLGNRRRMNAELDRALRAGADSSHAILVMFDLDGFKLYNDRFGHLAGDTLLAHLGARLAAAIGEAGFSYRPGGDEFCVLLHDVANADIRIAAAVSALSAEGEGFSVTTSFGRVAIPLEAQTATAALRLADDRMYAQKGGRRGSARQQTHDVLMGLLRERQPDLHDHICQVGRLAVVTGRRLRMTTEQLDELRRAAELHDIGKIAVPDGILNKPGPLSDHEWAFMRRHTIVGERILTAAPALTPVAAIVRSSHERWDGKGYPDGLAGEAIPLGARIVSVCDAFDAMTSDRPYAARISVEDAIAEIQREAGGQFDPTVVDAFVLAWSEDFASCGDAAEGASMRSGASRG